MASAPTKIDLASHVKQQLQAKSFELPMLPAVMTEVMTLCQSDTVDAARLSVVIHRDPTLAANVLRVANSAIFGMTMPCGSLQQAVSRLGMQKVSEIAMALAVRGSVFSQPECQDLLSRLWRHSLLGAWFSREIARQKRQNVEIAFLCGLLHDVGKAAILCNVLKSPGRVTMTDVVEALQEHHVEAGVLLARQWRLPEMIVECIECHHEPARAVYHLQLAMSVCLGDMLAHFADSAPEHSKAHAEVVRQHPVLAGLNLYPDQLEDLIARAGAARAFADGLS